LEYGRRNLTDGWKYKLQQIKKEILAKKGEEIRVEKISHFRQEGQTLSTVDNVSKHNTRQEIAKALDWSTGGGYLASGWKYKLQQIKKNRYQ
jgi:hypothetical protein